jgi:hypothetical protein
VCFRGIIKQIWSNQQISSTEFDLICNLILSLKHTKLNPSPQPIAYGGGGMWKCTTTSLYIWRGIDRGFVIHLLNENNLPLKEHAAIKHYITRSLLYVTYSPTYSLTLPPQTHTHTPSLVRHPSSSPHLWSSAAIGSCAFLSVCHYLSVQHRPDLCLSVRMSGIFLARHFCLH